MSIEGILIVIGRLTLLSIERIIIIIVLVIIIIIVLGIVIVIERSTVKVKVILIIVIVPIIIVTQISYSIILICHQPINIHVSIANYHPNNSQSYLIV